MRHGGGLLYLAVGCIAGGLLAFPARAATLQEAVRRALDRHPEVLAAWAEVAQARTEVDIARNAYLPALSASAGPAGQGLGYDVTLSQTLYDFGQASGQIGQKRAVLQQKEANFEVVRDDAALEVVEVYLDLAAKRMQIAHLDDHLKRLDALSETARARSEGRYADQAEFGRVKLAVAGARADRARLAGELAEAQDHYRVLLDEAPNGVQLPQPPVILEPLKDRAALDEAVLASPLYRRAASNVRAADAGLREARAARWPRLALEGSVQRREIGGRLLDDSVVALRFRMNAQQGLSGLQRPRLEAERREVAAQGAEAVARDLRRMVGSLGVLDQALERRIDAFADQSDQSDAVRGFYREQFLVGRREVQDLVAMETEHLAAERQVTELTIERLRMQYRTAAQLGLLAKAFVADMPGETSKERR